MDELDKDVAGLLGIDPQALEAEPADQSAAPRRRPGGRAAISVATAVSITALFVLTTTLVRPTPATKPLAPATKPAVQAATATRKLDMFVDHQASRRSPDSGVAEDQPALQAIVEGRGEVKTASTKATGRPHRARSPHKDRDRFDDALQVARADAAKTKGRPAPGAFARTVDLPLDTRTASRNEAQKTLVEDRLEAIDAIRLLRQR